MKAVDIFEKYRAGLTAEHIEEFSDSLANMLLYDFIQEFEKLKKARNIILLDSAVSLIKELNQKYNVVVKLQVECDSAFKLTPDGFKRYIAYTRVDTAHTELLARMLGVDETLDRSNVAYTLYTWKDSKWEMSESVQTMQKAMEIKEEPAVEEITGNPVLIKTEEIKPNSNGLFAGLFDSIKRILKIS